MASPARSAPDVSVRGVCSWLFLVVLFLFFCSSVPLVPAPRALRCPSLLSPSCLWWLLVRWWPSSHFASVVARVLLRPLLPFSFCLHCASQLSGRGPFRFLRSFFRCAPRLVHSFAHSLLPLVCFVSLPSPLLLCLRGVCVPLVPAPRAPLVPSSPLSHASLFARCQVRAARRGGGRGAPWWASLAGLVVAWLRFPSAWLCACSARCSGLRHPAGVVA